MILLIVSALLRESGSLSGLGKDQAMKRKKLLAALLSLVLLLALAPSALAAELPFPAEWFSGLEAPGFSLRDMIDPARGQIDLAGSSFQLKDLIFFDDAVVDEDTEICLLETNEKAMILDENTLPEGLSVEIRKEKVRIPDGKDGERVADEIRREKANMEPAEEPKIDPADAERETWYLYLTGKPRQAGESIFIVWDGSIHICSVTVLRERPAPSAAPVQPEQSTPTPAPVVEETWVDPWADPGSVTEGWVDTSVPMQLPEEQPSAPSPSPSPAFVLPTPSVSVTGSSNVTQGDSALLEAKVSNEYNAAYQWYVWDDAAQSWQILNGQTGNQYRPDTSAAGVKAYLCQVTNSYNGQTNSAWSDYVTVTVEAKPTQPELPTPTVTGVTGSTKVEQGASAMLEVHAANTYNASYQWYESNTPISGATDSQYRPDTSAVGTQTYVCQVTNTYNGQSTTAFSDPVTVTVEAKPELPTPTVSIAGTSQATVGDSVLLEARVSNGYNVSYQWFTSLGYYDAPIQSADATRSQFKPDTSRAGTWKYFCRVTSSGYGETITVDSEPITFTVANRAVVTPPPTPTPTPRVNKTISSVSVAKLPSKVDYNDGEAVDTTGLQLRVRYADGSYDVVDSGYVLTTPTVSYNNSGLANVNVNYRGYQATYQVKVHSMAELVRGIGVLTMPNKSSYSVGEYLNTAGLSIRVYSTDGRYLDVSEGFECSPTYFSNPGNQTVTVSFMGKTCTFTVAVQQATRVTGLTIQSLPANRSYTVGDTISTAGLVLQLQTTNGTQTVTSGYSISPRVATTAGTQQITVSYEGMSTSYTIDVRSNIPVATPSPTPTPFGATPSPAPFGTVSPTPAGFPAPSASPNPTPAVTPVHTPAPARRNTGVSTAVKALFAVAVISLGGLIGYVIYLRKTGDEEVYDEPSASEKLHKVFGKKDKK